MQAALIADLGISEAEVERNGKLVFAWDWLSLGLCLGWDEGDTPAVPLAGGDGRLHFTPTDDGATLDPWPFAVPELVVHCEGRRLEGRYDDEAALHAALDRSPLVRLTFRLTRTGAGQPGPSPPASQRSTQAPTSASGPSWRCPPYAGEARRAAARARGCGRCRGRPGRSRGRR